MALSRKKTSKTGYANINCAQSKHMNSTVLKSFKTKKNKKIFHKCEIL